MSGGNVFFAVYNLCISGDGILVRERRFTGLFDEPHRH